MNNTKLQIPRKAALWSIQSILPEVAKVILFGLAGLALKSLASHFAFFKSAFWNAPKLALYEFVLWSGLAVSVAIWITSSIMHRRFQQRSGLEASAAAEKIIALEIVAAQSKEEALRTSRTDKLTKLLNYEAFIEMLPEAFKKAREEKAPLMLSFFDIDWFKEVNDLVGHEYGNMVIAEIAYNLRPRPPDQIFRYGGDEFIVISPNTTITNGEYDDGYRMVSRLRDRVWALRFPKLSATSDRRFGISKVTVSAGVADTIPSFPKCESDTWELLLQRAESAFQRAKAMNKEIKRSDDFRGSIVTNSTLPFDIPDS
jgi:diguanylate cyclase (GGDEF)-like protein